MKKILIIFIALLYVFIFTGCNNTENNTSQVSSQSIQPNSSNPSDEIIIITSQGEKRIISQYEKYLLEKSASIITQHLLTFTAVPSIEKSVFTEDFTDEDIINFCISGGVCSDGGRFYDFEYEDFYPYIELGQVIDNKFVLSKEECETISNQLFNKSDMCIENENIEFDKSYGGYSKLMLNKGTNEIYDAVWNDGVLTAAVTIRLNKGDKIKYKADYLVKEKNSQLYLQLKEIHKGEVLVSFEPDGYIKNLYPQLEYTIVSRHGSNVEDMAFDGTCVYYKNQGEIGELLSFEELVAGNENYYINDNYYKARRNMSYLVENGNVVYTKDTRTEDSTGYDKLSRDDITLVSTYKNTVPVKVRYTNYMKSDRKPKQLWIDYFTQMKNNTKGAKDTPVVIYESYEFTIDGVECALVHCTNFVPVESYDGPVLDGPPEGSEYIYYNQFHYFVGNKREKTDRDFGTCGKVDTKPLSECTTSFCGDEIIHNDHKLKPQKLYCKFYDEQGNAAVYNIYDMMWTGDCRINMCREHDEEIMVIDIDGDGQVEILQWNYDHSMHGFHAYPRVYNLDKSTMILVSKPMNIEW